MDVILEKYSLLSDTEESAYIWLELVKKHSIKGKRAHDARIAAFVISHNLDGIVTLNPDDFKGIDIETIIP